MWYTLFPIHSNPEEIHQQESDWNIKLILFVIVNVCAEDFWFHLWVYEDVLFWMCNESLNELGLKYMCSFELV